MSQMKTFLGTVCYKNVRIQYYAITIRWHLFISSLEIHSKDLFILLLGESFEPCLHTSVW